MKKYSTGSLVQDNRNRNARWGPYTLSTLANDQLLPMGWNLGQVSGQPHGSETFDEI
jgi:hypothetical protein